MPKTYETADTDTTVADVVTDDVVTDDTDTDDTEMDATSVDTIEETTESDSRDGSPYPDEADLPDDVLTDETFGGGAVEETSTDGLTT